MIPASSPPAIPADPFHGMRPKIGIMGTCDEPIEESVKVVAHALGEAVANNGCILITGASPGLPYKAVEGAKSADGMVVGISPGLSLAEHIWKYESPHVGFDVLIFTGSGLMGREVENIRSSDIVVIIGGRSGTLGEFAIAYDEGKLIGVLQGTGGISDHIDMLARICEKDRGAHIIYGKDPHALVEDLLSYYKEVHCGQPSCFG